MENNQNHNQHTGKSIAFCGIMVAVSVVAMLLGMSIFFKVDTITVTGAQKYSEWTVSQASGLEKGDSLLFFGRAGAAGKIIRQLPFVKSVRFRILLFPRFQRLHHLMFQV